MIRAVKARQILSLRLYLPPAARWITLLKTPYTHAGVREYWIIDPQKERTTVYYYEEDAAPTIISFCQKLSVGIYKDLQICISELL